MNNDIAVTNATQDTTNINLEFATTNHVCVDCSDFADRSNVEVSYPPRVPSIHVGYKYPNTNSGVEWISHPKIDYSKCYPVLDRYILTPKRIWFTDNGRTTTVEWMDGTKTTVRAEDPEKATPYCGFTAALAKKIFGTGEAIRKMSAAIDKAKEPARLKEERLLAERARKRALREKQLQRHEERVAEYVEKLRVKREAEQKLNEEVNKKMVSDNADKTEA